MIMDPARTAPMRAI